MPAFEKMAHDCIELLPELMLLDFAELAVPAQRILEG